MQYKFSQLKPKAQERAAKDYVKGWLETREESEDLSEFTTEWGYERCQDTENDVVYNKNGYLISQ